jgi:tetratricopeptide (TPR) repeat protein
MGELDKAAASFQKVLEQEANNTSALIASGDILVLQGKLDEAVTFFEKAIAQTTDEVIPFNVAEIYFNQGNTAKALEYYQTAATRKPDWAEPHLKMGYANLNAGNMDAASELREGRRLLRQSGSKWRRRRFVLEEEPQAHEEDLGLAFALAASLASTQETGGIGGLVTDATGAVLPDCVVGSREVRTSRLPETAHRWPGRLCVLRSSRRRL